MKQFTTADRLKQLMDTRGLKQADIVRAVEPFCKKYGIKLGKSILSQYVSGRTEPGQEKLTILGMALNVSEAWLMGYDVPMERKTTPASLEEDGRLGEFASLFGQLTADQQALIVAQIKGILSQK